MTRLLAFLGGLLWLFSPLASFAQNPSAYQIEVIVYSHITEAGLKSESWPLLPPAIISPNTVELSEDQILPESSWRLRNAHLKLENNHYPVLLHIAWLETANELRKKKIIHLVGGTTYQEERQMDGTLAISLDRYFNLHFNLRFLMPWNSVKDNNQNPYFSFKIDESLRMRSNELNYIDHPLYGILIQITPMGTERIE